MNDSGTLKFVDDIEFHPNQLRQIESDNVEDRRNDPTFNDPRPPRIVDADEAEMTANYFFRSIMPPTKLGIDAGHGDIDAAIQEAKNKEVKQILDSMKKKR